MTTTTAPSTNDINQANHQVAEALERVLRSPSLRARPPGHHRPGHMFDFGEGWSGLAALRALGGNKRDVVALQQVEDALRHHDDVLSTAMQSAGMPKSVLDLLRTWMAVQLEARWSVVRAGVVAEVLDGLGGAVGKDAITVPEPVATREPMELLDANEMGQALGGMSDQIVRDREKGRELFSVLKAGRKRGREYPAFQVWDGIVGTPLASVLKALGSLDGAAAYAFFSSRLHELGGLTPVEVLSGTPTRSGRLGDDAQEILALPAARRLDGVLKAAEAFLADASA